MDLIDRAKNLANLQIGQTMDSYGNVQDVSSWYTTILRSSYGENHILTCDYFETLVSDIITNYNAKIDSDLLIELIPKIIKSLKRYNETTKDKNYATYVSNRISILVGRLLNIVPSKKKENIKLSDEDVKIEAEDKKKTAEEEKLIELKNLNYEIVKKVEIAEKNDLTVDEIESSLKEYQLLIESVEIVRKDESTEEDDNKTEKDDKKVEKDESAAEDDKKVTELNKKRMEMLMEKRLEIKKIILEERKRKDEERLKLENKRKEEEKLKLEKIIKEEEERLKLENERKEEERLKLENERKEEERLKLEN